MDTPLHIHSRLLSCIRSAVHHIQTRSTVVLLACLSLSLLQPWPALLPTPPSL